MVSGERILPYWFHQQQEYNLELLFPNDPAMWIANSILDKCVVQNERDCLASAKELLVLIEAELSKLKRNSQQLKEGVPWPCRVCAIGNYEQMPGDRVIFVRHTGEVGQLGPLQGAQQAAFQTVRVFFCENCGHIEFFRFNDGQQPKGWLPSKINSGEPATELNRLPTTRLPETRPRQLSDDARELLLEAIRDPYGYIMRLDDMQGTDVQTNNRHFSEVGNRRSEARWRSVVDELHRHGFIEDRAGNGEVFSVTDAGYRAGDFLKSK
jgi:hypothetical protein